MLVQKNVYNHNFNGAKYTVGKVTWAKNGSKKRALNTYISDSCGTGIHVFPTKAQAFYLNVGLYYTIEAMKKNSVPEYKKHIAKGFMKLPKTVAR